MVRALQVTGVTGVTGVMRLKGTAVAELFLFIPFISQL